VSEQYMVVHKSKFLPNNQ